MDKLKRLPKNKIKKTVLILILVLAPIILLINQGFHFSELKESFVVSIRVNENTEADIFDQEEKIDETFSQLIDLGNVSQIDRENHTLTFQNVPHTNILEKVEEVINNVNTGESETNSSIEVSKSFTIVAAKDISRILGDILLANVAIWITAIFFIFFVKYRKQEPKSLNLWMTLSAKMAISIAFINIAYFGILSALSRVYQIKEVDIYLSIVAAILLCSYIFLAFGEKIILEEKINIIRRRVSIITIIILLSIGLGLGVDFAIQGILVYLLFILPFGYFQLINEINFSKLQELIPKETSFSIKKSSSKSETKSNKKNINNEPSKTISEIAESKKKKKDKKKRKKRKKNR